MTPKCSQRPRALNTPSVQDIKDVYEFKKALGTGGFAKVFAGEHKATGLEVAIKHIQMVECAPPCSLAVLTIIVAANAIYR